MMPFRNGSGYPRPLRPASCGFVRTYDLQRWYFCQSHSVPSWFTTSGIRFGSARAAIKTGAIRQQPARSTMRRTLAVTLFLAFPLLTFAQNDLPTFTAEAASALVWGEDHRSGAVSSSIQDPVTGNAIHKLSYAGIEVSSRTGYERIGLGEVGELLNFTTTIVNNTESELSVRQGGASVDGHVALPLSVVSTNKGLSKRERKQVWELARMHCFSSGFLPNENFFSADTSSKVFTVNPKTALTVSFVTKDPRNYSMRCSVEGCFPTGTIRFSVTVNTTDFVFVWPGRAAVYCGG